MSTLYVGTDLESLADRLAERVEHGPADCFTPITIVVPHRHLARWLQLRLADKHGAVVNVRVTYHLDSVIWDLLESLDGRGVRSELLERGDYHGLCFAALLEESASKELKDLLAHSREPDGKRGRAFWRRTWQLAGRLAGLLREYEYHRHDTLIHEWLEGRSASKPANALEAGQRALLLRVMGLIEQLGTAHGKRYRTLPQYAREVMGLAADKLKTPSGGPIHIFAPNAVSAFHAQVLKWLGKHVDLSVYHQNPTAGHRESHASGIGSELLAAWGKAGAEAFHLLDSLREAPDAFIAKVVPSQPIPPSSVLAAVRAAITGNDTKPISQDRSLQIAACPGVVREVETVHASILENMRVNSHLRLTDIAVLVPNMAEYGPVIQSVFDRPSCPVRYNLSDNSAAELSVFGRAVVDLLDLAMESFTRSRVFSVLLNPCCLARFAIDREQALAWLDWTEKLGIFHGWNGAEKGSKNGGSSLYTWGLGLRRLRLGRIMDTGDESELQPAPRFGDVIPFADFESSDAARLDAFIRLVQGLLPRLAVLRSKHAGGEEWIATLKSLIEDFLAVPENRDEEAEVRDRLFVSLDQLRTFDLLLPKSNKLPLAFIREFVAGQLATMSATRGQALTEGVTIASLPSLLPLPFRIVYVLGLGEGEFPGSDVLLAPDLRAEEPHRPPGDVRPAEANRYLLLQAVLAAKEKLYLTFNGRDLQKDQDLHPCGPVNQFRRLLEEHLLKMPFHVETLPLSAYDATFFHAQDSKLPTDVRVCLSEPERALGLHLAVENGEVELTTKKQKQELQARLNRYRPEFTVSPDGDAELEPNSEEIISLRELAGFLRCPAGAAFKRHLRLHDEDEPEVEDDEPLVCRFPADHGLMRTALHRFLAAARNGTVAVAEANWQQDFDALYTERQLRSQVPDGAFGTVDRDRFKERIAPKIESLAGFLREREQEKAEYIGGIRLGESFSPTGAKLTFPALSISAEPAARIVGTLADAWKSKAAVHALVTTTASSKVSDKHLCKQMLEPVLFYLALRAFPKEEPAAKWLGTRKFAIHIAHAEGIATHVYEAGDFTGDEAIGYLRDLVKDFLDSSCVELLPFELFSKRDDLREAYTADEPPRGAEEYQELLAEVVEDDAESTHPAYRPMALLKVVDLAVPADALEKIRRRFRLLDRGPARNRAGDE